MKIIGVNGINSNGEGSTDVLLNHLAMQGLATYDLGIPVTGFGRVIRESITGIFSRRWDDKRLEQDARKLYVATDPGDAVVAHSRGAAVVVRAMKQGAQFSNVYLFAPAIDRRTKFPAGMDRCIVFFHPHDRALWAGVRVPFHYFGDMGATGYHGRDNRVYSVNTQHRLEPNPGPLPWHDAYFNAANIEFYTSWVAADLAASTP